MVLLAVGSGIAMAGPPTWPISWQVHRYQNHALVGRVWRPQAQAWARPAEVRDAVAKARFVMLGETHDNPDHHRLQAQLLQAMVTAGRHPTVAFEMLDLDQQPELTEFLSHRENKADALGAAVNWADSGWPAWSNYAPIARVALAAGLPIVAANLPTKTVRAVAMKGYKTLSPEQVKELGLDKPLAEPRREAMLGELFESHCKLVPKSELGGMVDAQRARNAIMAWRLAKRAGDDGGVLITGSGHARSDYGVPRDLHDFTPDATVLSVALIEVQPHKEKPSDYAAQFNVRQLPFDYVVFTPAATREDPCEKLRKRFGKGQGEK